MACLGVEPGVAGWKAQMNPLSYGGTPSKEVFYTPWVKCGPCEMRPMANLINILRS